MKKYRVLLVEDDRAWYEGFKKQLEQAGFDVTLFESGDQFLEHNHDQYDLAFVDLKLDGSRRKGWDVVERLVKDHPTTSLFVVSSYLGSSEDPTRKLLDVFAGDRLIDKSGRTFPASAVERALKWRAAVEERLSRGNLVHGHPDVHRIHRDEIPVIATEGGPVLILGETGTGKEIVARQIHRDSQQRGPFVEVNCAGIVPTLTLSELFGHQREAFTGADHHHLGHFLVASGFQEGDGQPANFRNWLSSKNSLTEVIADSNGEIERMGRRYKAVANGQGEAIIVLPQGVRKDSKVTPGTLFLDEVGDLPPDAQAALLRVLDGRGLKPVGYNGLPILPNVRIVAATSRIASMDDVGQSIFRSDIYWRLARWSIKLPPVKARVEYGDVGQRAQDIAREEFLEFEPEALKWFGEHRQWSGNWRQVEHVVRRAIAFAKAAGAINVAAAHIERAGAFELAYAYAESESPLRTYLRQLTTNGQLDPGLGKDWTKKLAELGSKTAEAFMAFCLRRSEGFDDLAQRLGIPGEDPGNTVKAKCYRVTTQDASGSEIHLTQSTTENFESIITTYIYPALSEMGVSQEKEFPRLFNAPRQ